MRFKLPDVHDDYPLLIEHITREAKLYRGVCTPAGEERESGSQAMGQLEQFWNQIMMEHALFIRGLLDPTENELIETAGSFADDYAALLSRARAASDQTLVRKEALAETQKFRAFKTAGVKGIEGCKIRSLILPLLQITSCGSQSLYQTLERVTKRTHVNDVPRR